MSALQLRSLEPKKAREGCCRVYIPKFPRGPLPPPKKVWAPLFPEYDFEADLPLFCHTSLILKLRDDEVRFRHEHASWHERCWFLHGRIVRGPDEALWSEITTIPPARHLCRVSTAGFEFSPETWHAQQEVAARTGDLLLGWIHTHSMEHIIATGQAAEKPAVVQSRGVSGSNIAGDGAVEKSRSTGLFLSDFDVQSAHRYGFSAAYQITSVLDSDACVRQEARLQDIVGIWGWYEGSLCRRSINMLMGVLRLKKIGGK